MAFYPARTVLVFILGLIFGLLGPFGLRSIFPVKHTCAITYPFRSEQGFYWSQFAEQEARLKSILVGQDLSCFYAFLSFNSVPANRINLITSSGARFESRPGQTAYNIIPKHWLEMITPIPSFTNALVFFKGDTIADIIIPDPKNPRHQEFSPPFKFKKPTEFSPR